ncbi:unnamed protein product [Litomosoides sigmodontis]|uniref:Receptor expression-enhancing protein n=1 Tax=Litomosoides sigmodontis TaxID=42156 RepID=A0A3P6TLL0_LITSI|nr:unnamed protein product [Litomosoides sigmodontis]
MSARLLRYLHEKSGIDECYLATFILSGISIYLITGYYARFVANAILTAVPILLTYVYPNEKPPFDNLLYYWLIYAIATLFFDSQLEDKRSYYWIKMFLLTLLIVFPNDEANATARKEHILLEKSSQIQIEKQRMPMFAEQLKPKLNFRGESCIHTTSISDSSIIPEIKLSACIENSQNALVENFRTAPEVASKKEVEELPDALLNESVLVPTERQQTIHLNESKDATTNEFQINTCPDNKIQELQNISASSQSVALSEITSINEVMPRSLRTSDVATAENFDSYVARKYELETASMQEPYVPLFSVEKLKCPSTATVSAAKERQILRENKSKVESAMQNPPVVGIQVSSWKESDAAETPVNHTTNHTASKQQLTASETINDSVKSDDNPKTGISHNSSKEEKSANAIKWIATGKTVVLMQNVKTKKVSLFQISS